MQLYKKSSIYLVLNHVCPCSCRFVYMYNLNYLEMKITLHSNNHVYHIKCSVYTRYFKVIHYYSSFRNCLLLLLDSKYSFVCWSGHSSTYVIKDAQQLQINADNNKFVYIPSPAASLSPSNRLMSKLRTSSISLQLS